MPPRLKNSEVIINSKNFFWSADLFGLVGNFLQAGESRDQERGREGGGAVNQWSVTQ